MHPKLDIGKLVLQKLKEKERSIAWLAKKIPCDRSNLYKMLQKLHIPNNMLWRISKILDYDFFKHYSTDLQEDNKNINNETYYSSMG
jgi:predicted transcriptional regulator